MNPQGFLRGPSCPSWLTHLAGSLLTPDALRLRKAKLVPFHIHARPAKRHSLHSQPESLFGATFSTQLDGPARADHAMPGQSRNLLQDAHHLAGGSRPARRPRDRPVIRHHPRRQGANAAHHPRALIFRRALLSPRNRLRFPFHKSAADEQQTLFLPNDQRRTTNDRPTHSC